jgi:hypothetical protein
MRCFFADEGAESGMKPPGVLLTRELWMRPRMGREGVDAEGAGEADGRFEGVFEGVFTREGCPFSSSPSTYRSLSLCALEKLCGDRERLREGSLGRDIDRQSNQNSGT